VEQVLYYVEQFTDSFGSSTTSPYQPQIPDAAAQARQITSGITNHCSHKTGPYQCERCTWAEFDFGLAMLEDGHADLAMTSFELGCRLARLLLSQPSKLFVRNLVMAFGSSRWAKFEGFRHKLLDYLALMAQVVLGDDHPITIILQHVATGDTLVACSELALRAMIATFEKTSRLAHPDVLLVKRSLSVILRRQQQFSLSEKLLLRAIHDSEVQNGVNHKETRRCLRRLGHLYMQEQRWDEAETVFIRILNSAPGLQQAQTSAPVYNFSTLDEAKDCFTTHSPPSSWIPDEISVYTYQHLARLSSDRGDDSQTRYWFGKELEAALKRWGPSGEYTTECLSLAIASASTSSMLASTEADMLASVVEQYPEILQTSMVTGVGGIFVSKARWCAVRNLI
jgi:tetratricopeptide (TPR) repeat protein